MPFPRDSLTEAQLATVRVLRNGAELPAFVEQLTPWRHLTDAAKDGASVRVARIQVNVTLGVGRPVSDVLTVEWGVQDRRRNVPALIDPRSAWHPVNSGTFAAADGVWEPDVYAVLPKEWLCLGVLRPTRMEPFAAEVSATRDDPAAMATQHFYPQFLWDQYGAKNFFFSLINEDDPRVTAESQCRYWDAAAYELWLFDRSSAMFGLYFRSGAIKALREAVRSTLYYHDRIGADGYFGFKPGDAKYSYNECLAYAHWLTGDALLKSKIGTVALAHSGTTVRWTPTLNFWTERHAGFKLLAHVVAYEVLGGVYRDSVLEYAGDLIWHQNGADGQIPSDRVDGGLYHYGAQHDWDWEETTLGASPWMSSAQPFDAMLRVYQCGESPEVAEFVRRHGTFLRAACAQTTYSGNVGARLLFPRYAVLYNGADGQTDEWTDPQHALEVASALAWSHYFAILLGKPNPTLRERAEALYMTYDDQVTDWVRPDAPASGLTAYRVSPWRRYNWEYRTSGGFSWAVRQTDDGGDPADSLPLAVTKALVRLNFAKPGMDRIQVQGLLPVVAGFAPTGQVLAMSIGGVEKTFTLNADGQAAAGADRCRIRLRRRAGAVLPQDAGFMVQLRCGNFAAALAADGLLSTDCRRVEVCVPVTVSFGGVVYTAAETLRYSARAGAYGLAE